jgi:FkbM family methyltransferase
MNNDFTEYLHLREAKIEGISPWLWLKNDKEAWIGLIKDWVESHKEKFNKHVTDFSVCVQAGGCMGMYPRLLSEMFNRVYTFEPDPLNFMCLVYNCQKNNIIKMQTALGHEHKLITVNRPSNTNGGVNTINEIDDAFIPMITLDSLNLDACGFIQLDVEFYELNVLRGALKTIEKYKPVISCELGYFHYFNSHINDEYRGLNHGGTSTEKTLENDILKLLEPYGYAKVDQSFADGIYKVI